MILRLCFLSLLGLGIPLLTGCLVSSGLKPPPVHAPSNYTADVRLPATIRRVLLLPVAAEGLAPVESARELDLILHTALQQENRFEVVRLDRDECRRRYGRTAFDSTTALPPGLLADLGREFAVDALLFVDLTAYRAHRPLTVGLRAKLATVADVRLVWAYDEVVTTEDPAVVNAVRQRYQRPGAAADLSPVALQSPSRFGAYAAAVMFGTLPPR